MATRPQRQPVQVNASSGLTAAGTRLLEVVGRHPSKGSHDRIESIVPSASNHARITNAAAKALDARRDAEIVIGAPAVGSGLGEVALGGE